MVRSFFYGEVQKREGKSALPFSYCFKGVGIL